MTLLYRPCIQGEKKLTPKAQGQMRNPLSLTPETNCATGSTVYNIENSESKQAVLALPSEGLYRKEYGDALKEVNDAQDFRDAGFIIGGVLLGTGIVFFLYF